MSMFGMSPAMQAVTNFPVQSREVGKAMSPPPKESSSGWDSFLRGAAQFAGTFGTGVMAGLQGYDPRNEYSSLAAGYLGATRGLQTQADIQEAQAKAAAGMEIRAAEARSQTALDTELARQAASGASIVSPGMGMGMGGGVEGVMAGVRQPSRTQTDDAGVQIGASLATERILRLIGMQP